MGRDRSYAVVEYNDDVSMTTNEIDPMDDSVSDNNIVI